MSLTTSLNIAKSSLAVTAGQTALISRNVADIDKAGVTRKTGTVITMPGGGVRLGVVDRATNDAVLDTLRGATADASAQAAIVDGLTTINQANGTTTADQSPAALISSLSTALATYASTPGDTTAGEAAIVAARNLANGLNQAAGAVQKARDNADAGMTASVDTINQLLAQFARANTAVVNGTASGADVSDDQDTRDGILTTLSGEIGIKTIGQPNGAMAIYTDSGVALFEGTARTVTFSPSQALSAGNAGNAVIIDGVPVTGASSPMAIGSGKLSGLSAVRDTIGVTYQKQLDELARGLVQAFAEKDQSATPTLPDLPGLFTYPGAAGVPAQGTAINGLSAQLKVNANVDPASGGAVARLRDGGISTPGNAAYLYNTANAAGYSDRLQALVDGLSATQSFDPQAGTTQSASVTTFASSSASWLQQARKTASTQSDAKNTLQSQASSALSKDTGVNLDDEMTKMLTFERSYQASSRLISTIDSMLNSLLQAV